MEKGKLTQLFDSDIMANKERSHSLWINTKLRPTKSNSEISNWTILEYRLSFFSNAGFFKL